MLAFITTSIIIKLKSYKIQSSMPFPNFHVCLVIRLYLLSQLSNNAIEFILLTARQNSSCSLKSFLGFANSKGNEINNDSIMQIPVTLEEHGNACLEAYF